jgi:hypothetical protein
MLTTKPKGLTHGYDDDGQNVGDKNIGVELDGVRHDARLYRRSVFIATKTPMVPALAIVAFLT